MAKIASRIVARANPTSISARARRGRWTKLMATFPSMSDMHVLDLGGTPGFWESAPVTPKHLTLVNMSAFPSSDSITSFQGDACAPPNEVASTTFDLVISNSLIEHVGGHSQRERLACVIRDAAPLHWVQTPYRYFPIEPHWLFPGLQFLPFAARVEITTRWKLGHRHTTSRQEAINSVHEVDLLGLTQMADYFPHSTIWREKFAGLVKSIVAIRTVG